jgi:transcriptional regulator with XRE-family HTH domain
MTTRRHRKDYSRQVPVEETHVLLNKQVLPENVRLTIKALAVTSSKWSRDDAALVRNSYLAALRHAGWTLQSIADATDVTRERIRQIETTTSMDLIEQISMFPEDFPIPPLPTETVTVYRYEPYEPDANDLARLLELQPFAQLVRSHSPRYREEAEEYAALLWKVHNQQKVTLYHLAQLLGVTHGALRFRLVRYGYMIATKGGNSKSYKPIIKKNRAVI